MSEQLKLTLLFRLWRQYPMNLSNNHADGLLQTLQVPMQRCQKDVTRAIGHEVLGEMPKEVFFIHLYARFLRVAFFLGGRSRGHLEGLVYIFILNTYMFFIINIPTFSTCFFHMRVMVESFEILKFFFGLATLAFVFVCICMYLLHSPVEASWPLLSQRGLASL